MQHMQKKKVLSIRSNHFYNDFIWKSEEPEIMINYWLIATFFKVYPRGVLGSLEAYQAIQCKALIIACKAFHTWGSYI